MPTIILLTGTNKRRIAWVALLLLTLALLLAGKKYSASRPLRRDTTTDAIPAGAAFLRGRLSPAVQRRDVGRGAEAGRLELEIEHAKVSVGKTTRSSPQNYG